MIYLYTDGACSINPGPGGWAWIAKGDGIYNRGVGFMPDTTNNRAELTAVIAGLRALREGVDVCVVTDSAYVRNGITTWMASWKAKGWKRTKSGFGKKKEAEIKNLELWQILDRLVAERNVTVELVKGHNGHPENEEVDRMAVEAYASRR